MSSRNSRELTMGCSRARRGNYRSETYSGGGWRTDRGGPWRRKRHKTLSKLDPLMSKNGAFKITLGQQPQTRQAGMMGGSTEKPRSGLWLLP